MSKVHDQRQRTHHPVPDREMKMGGFKMMLKKKRGYIGIPTVLVLAVLLSLLSPMALATSLTDTISETGITAVVEYERKSRRCRFLMGWLQEEKTRQM